MRITMLSADKTSSLETYLILLLLGFVYRLRKCYEVEET